MELIDYKFRLYGVKDIFLSGLTITNRLLEQLIKDFIDSICNICCRAPNCGYINNTNIMLNEVCRYGLYLSGIGKYAVINNYRDNVPKNL